MNLDFGGRQRLPLILQSEAAECGLACLAMVASYHGHRTDLNALRRRYPVSMNGMTLRALMQIAGYLHLSCRALRFELENLSQLSLPAIVHWDMNHFVVLKSVTGKGISVHDPASGAKFYPLAEASKHLSGVGVELSPTESFVRQDERHRLPFSVFFSSLRGGGGALVQVFVLSLVLQALVLAGPFYMQLTIDEVVARGDVDLLIVLALGFGLLTLIRVATTAVRSLILVVVQNTLHFNLGARLFRHLIRLPTSYFEKRHIGGIQSRFASLEPIRNLLAEGIITAAIDGLMAAATLAMIFIYSPQLAMVVLTALFFYAALRLGLYRILWQRTEASIQAVAHENTSFIETVRAIQPLKLHNRESEREGQWLNRYADVANANVRLGRARIAFTTLNDTIFGIELIITVYLAAKLALGNAMTIGMIFAFMSYRQHFTDKAVQLIEKALEFRLLGLHLERLSDIALTPLEPGHDQPLSYVREVEGRIELRNVFFRYSETEPFVLENVSLTIEPGEFVTITGPSGGGKTTLIKIMLGLLQPTSGEVLIDGLALPVIGVRAYREQVSAVMQEDQLLSGSIADNVCFFDAEFNHEKMVHCAKLAAIHDEIMSMPMSYNSLVGDMGSSLSGGQKQRILLARALYRVPRILFLDEGTAHLDVENERCIHGTLKGLKMTRISIAHRPDSVSGAERIVRVARTIISDSGAKPQLEHAERTR